MTGNSPFSTYFVPKAVACTQCSSNDLAEIDIYRYRCNHCGTLIQVGNPPGSYFKENTGSPIKGAAVGKILKGAAIGILVLGGLGFFLLHDQPGPPPTKVEKIDIEGHERTSYGSESIEPEKELTGSFTKISKLPDSIGNLYVVGIARNTGDGIIRQPRVEVKLYDKKGNKIATGAGYGFRSFLLPGEESAVKVLVKDAPKFHRLEAGFEPEKPFYLRQRPKLKIEKAKMTPARYSGYSIRGQVKNIGEVGANYTKVGALLYSKEDRIIGMRYAYLGEKKLMAGDTSPFKIDFHSIPEKPVRFELDYDASPIK